MKRAAITRLLMAVALCLLVVFPTHADESPAIEVQLKVTKIELISGREVFVAAETIRPGDLLLYEIIYKIKGKDEVLELLAQLPIPEGMEYLPDSAQPSKVLASLDGIDFSPVPLTGKFKKLVDGKESLEDIPTVKYRALGWTMRGLAPGDEFAVSARLKVDFIPDAK